MAAETGLSQNEERARVRLRIKALLAKTVSNGCTEAEAMAAAGMVGRLLERYALTMDEIEWREEPCVTLEVQVRGRQRQPVDGCVPAIARFCDCRVWLSRDEAGARYCFFGFEADAAMCVYLFELIERAMRHEHAAFKASVVHLRGTDLRRAGASFQHGMAARIAERLAAGLEERHASTARAAATGSALVVAKDSEVDRALKALGLRLRTGVRRVRRHDDGHYQRGRARGDSLNLNRPVQDHRRSLLRG